MTAQDELQHPPSEDPPQVVRDDIEEKLPSIVYNV
jgi:hypothetical protein